MRRKCLITEVQRMESKVQAPGKEWYCWVDWWYLFRSNVDWRNSTWFMGIEAWTVLTFGRHIRSLEVIIKWNYKHQQCFFDLAENWGHRAKHCPQTTALLSLERQTDSCRELQVPRTEAQKQKTPVEPVSSRVGKPSIWWFTVGSVWTSLRDERSGWEGGPGLSRPLTLLWVLFPEDLPDSHSEYKNKIS